MRLFVDTSAWFAFGNKADKAHATVAAALQRRGARLVTSNLVCAETITLVRAKAGHAAAVRLGAYLRSGVAEIAHVEPADEEAAWTLFCERPDKKFSFTDCTSFVVMKSLAISHAVTLDDDFRQEGFQVVP